jgi:hypothetical protein
VTTTKASHDLMKEQRHIRHPCCPGVLILPWLVAPIEDYLLLESHFAAKREAQLTNLNITTGIHSYRVDAKSN